MAKSSADKLIPYVDRYLDNDYARKNAGRAGSAIRDAYHRASRKGLRAPADRKFRDRVADSVIALRETSDAIQHGRRKPRGQTARRVGIAVLTLGAVAVVALAANDDLRAAVMGDETTFPPADPVAPPDQN